MRAFHPPRRLNSSEKLIMPDPLAGHPSFRPHRLAGKLCLITGASKGIGEAIARLFALHGASCVLVARSRDALEFLVKDLAIVVDGQKHAYFEADFADPLAADAAMDAFEAAFPGRAVDALICNAGYFPDFPLEKLALEDFNRIIQVNLTATYQVVKRCVPGMRTQKSGRIVFTSSINATNGTPGLSAYGAAKAGLQGFMYALAMEVARDQILVNAVAPGYALTPGLKAWVPPSDSTVTDDELFPEWKKIIPLGRLAKPEEIAGTVLWLASEENSYITAQTIVVDGGQTRAENQTGLW